MSFILVVKPLEDASSVQVDSSYSLSSSVVGDAKNAMVSAYMRIIVVKQKYCSYYSSISYARYCQIFLRTNLIYVYVKLEFKLSMDACSALMKTLHMVISPFESVYCMCWCRCFDIIYDKSWKLSCVCNVSDNGFPCAENCV
jgi:hypothetical protein